MRKISRARNARAVPVVTGAIVGRLTGALFPSGKVLIVREPANYLFFVSYWWEGASRHPSTKKGTHHMHVVTNRSDRRPLAADKRGVRRARPISDLQLRQLHYSRLSAATGQENGMGERLDLF